MNRLACLALIAALTIGTMVTATAAGAFERYRVDGFDAAFHEPFERTTSPTWTPTWSPTWTPEPQRPDPAPTYHAYPETGGCLSEAEVASYASGVGFPESIVPTMVSIAARESGLCAGAINPISGACGLWHIYPCPGSDALDPARNAALAYMKYEASGLSPWASSA
jgi:hypothetical protein